MAIEIAYFNSYWAKRLKDSNSTANSFPKWLNGNPAATETNNWYIEEARIRGGYNNTNTDYGVKAYIVEDEPQSQQLGNGLIYSGIFNSKTGFNNTNVFSVGESITKSVDPAYGSIQKLYAEDTNLTIFQENKVSRALIDKDAIYSAEGGGTVTSTSLVIGQIVPYAGEFGISKNPESFAVYGYQKYFADSRRNSVLRLSRDGITEISNYGMKDWFRDELNNLPSGAKVVGGYDIHNKVYYLSLQANNTWQTSPDDQGPYLSSFNTLYYDETVKGWPSFVTFKPTLMASIRNKFLSFSGGRIYEHYTGTSRTDFYNDGGNPASITFTFNPNVSAQKVFKTINYEGSNNWELTELSTQDTGRGFTEQRFDVANPIKSLSNGLYYLQGVAGFIIDDPGDNYEEIVYSTTGGSGSGLTVEVSSVDGSGGILAVSVINPGAGYRVGDPVTVQGGDFSAVLEITSVSDNLNFPRYAGFYRKEDKYFANIVNNSTVKSGEIVFGKQMTGIKGFFATGIIQTNTADAQELFAVSSEYIESSY
jgi:hypothetical protein